MKGWIIYKNSQEDLRPEAYGIHRLLDEAGQNGCEVRVLAPEDIDIIVSEKEKELILVKGREEPRPDFVLPRMGAATSYFALAVIRQLESLGVYSCNSAVGIETVKDKMRTLQVLAQNGIPVPKTMLAKFPVDVDLVEHYLGFPVVVKTLVGSQGRGVFLCETRSRFEDLLAVITMSQGNPHFIVQEFIETSRGKDIRALVIGGRVLGCMSRVAPRGAYKANVSQGAAVSAYPMTPELEGLAIRTARVLGLEVSGVDLLFSEGTFKICEANSSPGFKGMESVCPVNVPREIYNRIRLRMAHHQSGNRLPVNAPLAI